MIIMDGKKTSDLKASFLKEEIEKYIKKGFRKPKLAIILIGDDPASHIYVNAKVKRANLVNIETELIIFEKNCTQKQVESKINKLNHDETVDGIIIQLPLPNHLDTGKLLDMVTYTKDVDGFNVINQGLLFQKRNPIISATPKGIIDLIDNYQIELEGKSAVVVGRSLIVGLPISKLLLDKNMTVTTCHRFTKNLKEFTKNADLIVVAAGVKHLITEDMVKENVIIIDVGINRVDGKIYGDCDFENCSKKASYITPVPGGVGPMTIIALLENVISVYKNHIKK